MGRGDDASGRGDDASGTGDDASGRGDDTDEGDAAAAGDARTLQRDCSNPDPSWIACEDFEQGSGNYADWCNASDFKTCLEYCESADAQTCVGHTAADRITLTDVEVHRGYSLYMPAAASAGYQGADLKFVACQGPQAHPCTPLRSYERLYFRAWVRFAPDHREVHHFLSIGGSQPDRYWSLGSAGCLRTGELSMGVALDCQPTTHDAFFYTYYPEMSCNPNCASYMGEDGLDELCAHCASIGMPTCDPVRQCCWGDEFPADPAVRSALPVGEWFCLEILQQANTPGVHDGVMAYWVNGELGQLYDEMMWRTVPELALNRVNLQHYNTTEDAGGHSNRVWFDDVVVSTEPIGCE